MRAPAFTRCAPCKRGTPIWRTWNFSTAAPLSFTLAGPIEEAGSLIVIDATQLQAQPGTVRVFEGEDMDRFLGSNTEAQRRRENTEMF